MVSLCTKKYGGKIFTIAQVSGVPQYYKNEGTRCWGSNIYAEMDNIYLLDNPVDISEFNSFITVPRQSGITAV